MGGQLWLTAGTRTLATVVLGVFIGVSPLGGCHFLIKTKPHPTACRLQYWDTSGQTTNRAGTQPHQSADWLLKVFLSTQLPNKHPLTWHCLPDGQDPATPTSGQVPVLPNRKLAQASLTASTTRGQRAEARRTTTLQPVEWKLQSQKVSC